MIKGVQGFTKHVSQTIGAVTFQGTDPEWQFLARGFRDCGVWPAL